MGGVINTVTSALGGSSASGSVLGGLGGIGNTALQLIDNVAGTNMSGNSATNQALDAQQRAADQANATQLYMYNQSRADSEPWRQAGQTALSTLAGGNFMNDWQQDPGYQFRLNEGLKAVGAAASARGMNNSGATLKALTRYGQDYASNEYQKGYDRQMNRLSMLAGYGTNANSNNQANNTNYANQVSNNYTNMGNAQGAAYLSGANRLTNLLSTVGGAAMRGS